LATVAPLGVGRGRGLFVRKLSGFPAESLRGLSDRQPRDILLPALHAADMRAVDAYALGHSFLAPPGGKAATTQDQIDCAAKWLSQA
jgi:hypothetical protein